MPQLAKALPKYRKHRASGQAVVTIEGRDFYLGDYRSRVSRAEYDRIVGEWLANGRRLPQPPSGDIRVVELINAYWQHCKSYYRKPDGSPTSELAVHKQCLKPVKRLYGHVPVRQFGPLSLANVANEMIKLRWCRKPINKHIGRVKRMFRWGAAKEIIPGECYHALAPAFGLAEGRTDANEGEPVRPVDAAAVEAVRPLVSPQVRDMIDLQLLTGMRPGEACIVRACDITIREGDLWLYRPSDHKNRHRGHDRTIYLGPKAQEIIKRNLKPDTQAYLFSPRDADAHRRAKLREVRKTPIGYGNAPGTNRRRRPKRKPGDRYDVAAYRRAIERACETAFGMPGEFRSSPAERPSPDDTPEQARAKSQCRADKAKKRAAWHAAHCWTPHQLRHTAATKLREEYGIEAAQVILGHKTLSVTELYAEKNVAAAQRIMSEVG